MENENPKLFLLVDVESFGNRHDLTLNAILAGNIVHKYRHLLYSKLYYGKHSVGGQKQMLQGLSQEDLHKL